jgi:hypothetical protein
MLILKYFAVVGIALMAGLMALSAHMTSASTTGAVVRPVAVAVQPPAPAPEPEPVVAAPVEQPKAADKRGSKSRRSHADRGKQQSNGPVLR